MAKSKNSAKNLYQIGIIIGVIAMMLYGYALYIASSMKHTSDVYWNLAIMAAWFFLTIYWLRQLGRIAKDEKENKTT